MDHRNQPTIGDRLLTLISKLRPEEKDVESFIIADTAKVVSLGSDGNSTVFEGLRKGRSVFVKRIKLDSIDDIAAANIEVQNHHALEKGMKWILTTITSISALKVGFVPWESCCRATDTVSHDPAKR